MDVGLLILRLLLAFVLYAHATQKVFGWFSGPGLGGAAAIFEKLGRPQAAATRRPRPTRGQPQAEPASGHPFAMPEIARG